ncbi:lysM domain-containing GPI-anchored protein 1-like [Prosopis cineraria]|uniref:lysM domain-containing GPI-anchored protein 1-like n=1 Tax=Prosopis cineraria TaxID=364024 RepID=UPI00240FBD7A|nr:lysM domain-containing GPI-anchored protein 1-like [Prosopis cineraria]
MMKSHTQFPLGLALFSVVCLVQTKSIIEPCVSSDSCFSLLSFVLPWDSKLSEIASRFQVNVSDILAANSVFPMSQKLADQIIRSKSIVKIPISCPCVDGIRRSMSTIYTVQASDTLENISEGFGRLVSADQIASVNSINATNRLTNGGKLVIPLPCTCFNNVRNGETTVYMSYAVSEGESLRSIASGSKTTVSDLEAINGLSQDAVEPGDIIAIPIAACSSASLNWYNESLIVPNGSYALTATDCIKCSCGPIDLRLQCYPSGLEAPCFNLQCKDSNLVIGDQHVTYFKSGCNVTQCVYRGHRGGKILRSVSESSYLRCPANQTYNAASPWPSINLDPVMPFGAFSPSPSPSPVSDALVHATQVSIMLLPLLLWILINT